MWIKVCGIRDIAAARLVAEAGGDAVGLNFYRASARAVEVSAAVEIVRSLPESVEPVGLFVNAPEADLTATAQACGFQTIQLHGEEPPELLARLARQNSYRLIRAFRVGSEGLEEMDAELARLESQGVELFACLIDAHVKGQYGGTGRRAPWDLLAREWSQRERPRMILAGGLTPENVVDAIATCRPWGVDVAGGVEVQPGVKDPARIRAFIENARSAS